MTCFQNVLYVVLYEAMFLQIAAFNTSSYVCNKEINAKH